MPDVTVGFSGSKGMAFLLQVMPARSRLSRRPCRSASWAADRPASDACRCRPRRCRARSPAASAASARALSTTALGVGLNSGLQRLAEGHRLGGDHVHQRPALEPREDRRVDLLADLLVVARGSCRRAGRAASCAWSWSRHARAAAGSGWTPPATRPGEMRHVDHEIGADRVGDRAEAREIDDARIGRAAGDDQLRLVLARQALDLVDSR